MERVIGLKQIEPPIVWQRNEELLKQFNLTWSEVQEYCKLKAQIYGKGGPFKTLFVTLDLDDPDHARYNELSGKMIHLHAHLLAHRND